MLNTGEFQNNWVSTYPGHDKDSVPVVGKPRHGWSWALGVSRELENHIYAQLLLCTQKSVPTDALRLELEERRWVRVLPSPSAVG